MAGQQDTLKEQWRITIVGGGGVVLAGLLVEKFILDPIAPESPWVSIPVLATIITVGIAMARYWLIMGSYAAAAKGTRERKIADGLRRRLKQGGDASKIYEATLTRFLNAVDRFFGDADPAVKTLWPRAFGFEGKEGQKPFWTAPAYDRCLTIALLYPLLAMLIIWTVTGAVGPGEKAIGLSANVEDWWRWVGFACLAISGINFYLTVKVNDPWLGCIFGLVAFALAFAVLFAFPVSFSFLFVLAVVGVHGVARTTAAFNDVAHKLGQHGLFLLMLTLAYLTLCYIIADWLGGTEDQSGIRTLLLFLGVLTLVNAPFDWLTIGLTRALLRRGLELRRWWPLALALLDLVLAAALIVLLAIAMLLAVQAFEYVGGTQVLGVEKVLNDLADPVMRTHPEYWWIYTTLFSTLIPSIINVAIGALSIMRGSGGFHRYIAAKMPAGQAMLLADALWAVPLLALEVLGSVVIGVALTLGWIWVVVAKLFPLFGGLIPMLRAVAGLA